MITEKNDIKENRLLSLDKELLNILLKDKTTEKNLIWATDMYKKKGFPYYEDQYIKAELITGYYGNVIKPRIEKSKSIQQKRSRDKAEVFTPSWVCNAQNNLIDNAWFGKANIFNKETDKAWETNYNTIKFSDEKDKNWTDYVKSNRLEITCGEAPYLASRYDTVTGNYIAVKDRIGLLDRKLRVVSENTNNEEDWIKWATISIKSVYGYDWQGDNVLIARENLLYTIIEHYENKFNKELDLTNIKNFAKIIVWNIWQMDGLKCVIPNSCHKEESQQLSLFSNIEEDSDCTGCMKNDIKNHNGIYCKIMDWDKKKSIRFVDLIGG